MTTLRSLRQRAGRALDLLLPRGTWPEIGPSTFIVWEPSSRAHGEVVPGYAYYLLALGYDVLVLVAPSMREEGLFCRFAHPRLRFSRLSERQMRVFLARADLSTSAGLIVTTASRLPRRADGTIDEAAAFGERPPPRLLYVEHDPGRRIEAGLWQDDFITLRDAGPQGFRSIAVNPHVFGARSSSPKSPDTCFLVVGADRPRRGNRDLLYDAALRLKAAGHDQFRIRMIGKPGRRPVPAVLADHVEVLGRLPFRQLYDEVERADVLVSCLQKHNPDHRFYFTSGTTGILQLSLGFGTPCLVQSKIAALSGLSPASALTYDEDEDFYGAMLRAMTMGEDDQRALCAELEAVAEGVRVRSLANLRQGIAG